MCMTACASCSQGCCPDLALTSILPPSIICCRLLWSTFVITGAYYFVRSLIANVNGTTAGRLYSQESWGWGLSVGFFLDAWFLGEQQRRRSLCCLHSLCMPRSGV